MGTCGNFGNCALFSGALSQKPATTKLLKRMFCDGKYTGCARYFLLNALGPDKVPPGMFPGDMKLAKEIAASSSRA